METRNRRAKRRSSARRLRLGCKSGVSGAGSLRSVAASHVMPASSRILTKIDRALAARGERTRWRAAIALGEFTTFEPESIWPLVLKHGSRRHADARMAIATCVLEHILEHHFDTFFPRVADAARSSHWFADTARSCWLMGESELPRNARRWRRLMSELRATPPNHALQRSRRERHGCNRCVPCAGSLNRSPKPVTSSES